MAESSVEHQVDAEMLQMHQRYLSGMATQMTVLEQVLLDNDTAPLSADLRAQLRLIAHKLAGNGRMYGFPPVSEHGLRLDDALTNVPDLAGDSLRRLTQALLDACNTAQMSRSLI